MRKRLFIAVNLPEEVKHALSREAGAVFEELPAGLNARPSDPDELHFTIIFLNGQEEDMIPKITEAMQEAVSEIKPFRVHINRIDYNPEHGEKRMVWAYGQSPKMMEAWSALEKTLKNKGIFFKRGRGKFIPHVTLARFNQKEASALPMIAGEANLEFKAEGLDLMESCLSEKPRYYVVQSIDLRE